MVTNLLDGGHVNREVQTMQSVQVSELQIQFMCEKWWNIVSSYALPWHVNFRVGLFFAYIFAPVYKKSTISPGVAALFFWLCSIACREIIKSATLCKTMAKLGGLVVLYAFLLQLSLPCFKYRVFLLIRSTPLNVFVVSQEI